MSGEAGETPNAEGTPNTAALVEPPRSTQNPHLGIGAESVEESLHTMQKADPQENKIQKVYLAISKKVTSQNDATTLGIHLGIDHDDVKYHVTNYDVRDAAYRFLCWADENYGPVKRWEKIIEALETLQKNTTIGEPDLEERLAAAKQEKPVHDSVHLRD